MKALISAHGFNQHLDTIFTFKLPIETIMVKSCGEFSFLGNGEPITTTIHQSRPGESFIMPFESDRWERVYRFLKSIPDQPIVIEIEDEGESIQLSQFTMTF